MSTPTFEDACRACDYASTHGTNFIASFRALAAICRDIGQEAVASKAKDLLRLILCSAPLCCTAKHTKVVRSVAICVLESGPAASALLATGLIKGSSIYAHKFNPRACCLVIRTHSLSIISFAGRALFLHLSCRLLAFTFAPAAFAGHGSPEVSPALNLPATICAQLVSQQLKWAVEITRMGSGRTEWSQKYENGVRLRSRLHPCLRCLAALLRAVPSCRDLYISALGLSFEEDPDTSSLTAQIIMEAVVDSKQQESLWGTPVIASMAARIAENACSSILIVKTAITHAAARRLHLLFVGLSKDVFIGSVLPLIARGLLRTPALIAPAIAQVFSSVQFDLSFLFIDKACDDVVSSLIDLLKIEGSRDNACTIFEALAIQSSDSVATKRLLLSLCDLFSRKGVCPVQQRLAHVCALSCVLVNKPAGISKHAAEISSAIAAATARENHDDVLTAILPLCIRVSEYVGSFDESTSRSVKSAMLHISGTVRQSLWRALLECSEKASSKILVPFISHIQAAIESAVTKPAFRGDGAAALAVMSNLSVFETAAASALKAVSNQVLKRGCFLADLLENFPSPYDVEVAAQASESLLLKNASGVDVSSCTSTLLQALAFALSHQLSVVRAFGLKALARLSLGIPSILPQLCHTCVSLVFKMGDFSSIRDASHELPFSAFSLCHGIQATFRAMDEHAQMEELPRLLVCCNHVILARSNLGMSLWDGISSCAQRSFDVNKFISSHCEKCLDIVFAEGLQSHEPTLVQGAMNAIGHLARIDFEKLFKELYNRVEKDLIGDVISISSHDIEVYFTPPDRICIPLSRQSGYVAQVVQNENVKLSKAEKKLYGADVTRSLMHKPQPQAPKRSKEEEAAFRSKLEAEAVVRANVTRLLMRARLCVQCICTALEATSVTPEDHVLALCVVLSGLAKQPLLAIECIDLARSVLMTCDRMRSSGFARSVSVATVSCLTAEDTDDELLCASSLLQGCISKLLHTARSLGAFSPAIFTCLLPIIRRGLLHCQSSDELRRCTLQFIGLHCEGAHKWPKGKVFDMLCRLVAEFPSFHSEACIILFQHAIAARPSDAVPLLNSLLVPSTIARRCAIKTLARITGLPGPKHLAMLVCSRLWVSCHDSDPEVMEIAKRIWDALDENCTVQLALACAAILDNPSDSVQQSIAVAVAEAVSFSGKDAVRPSLERLLSMYEDAKSRAEVELASAITMAESLQRTGRAVELDIPDPTWMLRRGIGNCIVQHASLLPKDDIQVIFTFILLQGLRDINDSVRSTFLQAGISIIESHGKQHKNALLALIEARMAKESDSEEGDVVREGCVVMLGTLAMFMEAADPKLKPVVARLITALDIPSESVQAAVAQTLPGIMHLIEDRAPVMIADLLQRLQNNDSFVVRRGAAFGLAGCLSGLTLAAIKKFDIMKELTAAATDKKSEHRRQGAMFAFECMSRAYGKLFEPYIIVILPLLLSGCGESVPGVREAAEGAARVVMSQLSGQGVKLVVPALKKGLEEDQWRAKVASVALFGSMAYCSPKQLGNCLPAVVPTLAEIICDVHPRVQEAARLALKQVADVISNPEIKSLSPILLKSYSDLDATGHALECIAKTTFVNCVDAASLALIVPVVIRGLQLRESDAKIKAAQIIANMCSLVSDVKDVFPYLDNMLPGLQVTLLDPYPEVRHISARALGALALSFDSAHLEHMLPWLLQRLQNDSSSVERYGAAQGLSYVLAAGSIQAVHNLLPELLLFVDHDFPHVREGMFALLSHLPVSMGQKYAPFISISLPVVLRGLSDVREDVRSAALRAANSLVEEFSGNAMPVLLPAVESGLNSENWRIRQSSVTMLGYIFQSITGTTWQSKSGAALSTPDNNESSGMSSKAKTDLVVRVMGEERRNNLLALLYMLRSDVHPAVEQLAFQVWKSVTDQGSKTLKAIMPWLVRVLTLNLASEFKELQDISSAALGDLVGKFQEIVLLDVIPMLHSRLSNGAPNERVGVCKGLSEVMGSAKKATLSQFLPQLTAAITAGVCDPQDIVKSEAAIAFGKYYESVGKDADAVVMNLLQSMSSEISALDGLRYLMNVRAKSILPIILARLTPTPMNIFCARALASLAQVSGAALTADKAGKMLDAIARIDLSIVDDSGSEVSVIEQLQCAERVIKSIRDDVKAEFMVYLKESIHPEEENSPKAKYLWLYIRYAGMLASTYDSDEDELEELGIQSELVEMLMEFYCHSDLNVLAAAVDAIDKIIKSLKKEAQVCIVPCIHKTLNKVVATYKQRIGIRRQDEVLVPAICEAKGIAPLMATYIQGLLNGSPEVRVLSGLGMEQIVSIATPDALKPYVVQATGPLIRSFAGPSHLIGTDVKIAILSTLSAILLKGAPSCKPFVPQLQTTFVKALQDPSSTVRNKAAGALSLLIPVATRVDPLLAELQAGLGLQTGGVKSSLYVALSGVFRFGADKISPSTHASAGISLLLSLGIEDEEVRSAACACIGHWIVAGGSACITQQLQAHPGSLCFRATSTSDSWKVRFDAVCAISHTAKELSLELQNPSSIYKDDLSLGQAFATCASALHKVMGDERIPLRQVGALAVGHIIRVLVHFQVHSAVVHLLLMRLGDACCEVSSDVRLDALIAMKSTCKFITSAISPSLPELLPKLLRAAHDRSVQIQRIASRTLFHALCLPLGSTVIDSLAFAGCSAELLKSVSDIYKSTLSKLVIDDSDYEADAVVND